MAQKIWISEISQKEIGAQVTISGIVIGKRKSSKDTLVVQIKDLSDTINVSVHLSEKMTQSLFWKNTQLQLTGVISENSQGNRYLNEVNNVLVFAKNESNDISLSSLDTEVNKKASIMLMSKMCRSISNYFIEHDFIEFESRVISLNWKSDGLETLNVLYPGFGSHATLITSPSPQIMEFMKVAMLTRAFTESSSFATTYRFKDGAAETKIIMAKSLDFTETQLKKMIFDIACKIINEFGNAEYVLPLFDESLLYEIWPTFDETKVKNVINLITFSVSLEISNENYASKLERIVHIIDRDGNILAEGAQEKMPNDLFVSTITVYPSQFLSLLKKAPTRQLQDLWRKNGWR